MQRFVSDFLQDVEIFGAIERRKSEITRLTRILESPTSTAAERHEAGQALAALRIGGPSSTRKA